MRHTPFNLHCALHTPRSISHTLHSTLPCICQILSHSGAVLSRPGRASDDRPKRLRRGRSAMAGSGVYQILTGIVSSTADASGRMEPRARETGPEPDSQAPRALRLRLSCARILLRIGYRTWGPAPGLSFLQELGVPATGCHGSRFRKSNG